MLEEEVEQKQKEADGSSLLHVLPGDKFTDITSNANQNFHHGWLFSGLIATMTIVSICSQ